MARSQEPRLSWMPVHRVVAEYSRSGHAEECVLAGAFGIIFSYEDVIRRKYSMVTIAMLLSLTPSLAL